MIKILILSDPNSPHTVKWVKSLANEGINVYLWGLTPVDHNLYKSNGNITFSSLEMRLSGDEISTSKISKLKYLKGIRQIKRIIKTWKPNLVHAHYATSYGLLAVLANFHPLIISVWGSDVFEFPKISYLHKSLFKYILSKPDALLSTSKVMASETSKYTSKKIEVTPFGIDLKLFKPVSTIGLFNDDDLVIGTVKNLEKIYGIDTLIKSSKLLKDKYQKAPLKLLIAGSGTQEINLKRLVKSLNLEKDTIFAGKIENTETPNYYSMMDVAVFLSSSESFGVSALEASACKIPVVAANVGGFTEIVENNVTGLLVEPGNPAEAARAIERILFEKDLAASFGESGRQKVIKNYDWKNNLNQMISIYNRFAADPKIIINA